MRHVVWGTEADCKKQIKKCDSSLKWIKASKAEHKEHAKVFGFDAKKPPFRIGRMSLDFKTAGAQAPLHQKEA